VVHIKKYQLRVEIDSLIMQDKDNRTEGQKVADEYREKANTMSDSERERNFKEAMAIIYGGKARVECQSQ
jgi:hypothetical protein